MGYTSQADMRRQIRLEFETRDEAIAYAERNGIPYSAAPDHNRRQRRFPTPTTSVLAARSPGPTDGFDFGGHPGRPRSSAG